MLLQLLILPTVVTSIVAVVIIREIRAIIKNSNADMDKQEEENKDKRKEYFPQAPQTKKISVTSPHPEPY